MPIDSKVITQLQQNDPDLVSLNLAYKFITSDDIERLVNALSSNTHLTSLDISRNEIGDEGAKYLSQNTTLTSLNVSSNQIGVEGAKALSQHPNLTLLKMHSTPIAENVIERIGNRLEANKQQQRRRRNGFILTLQKGLATLAASAGTSAQPLPPELLIHTGSFLNAKFYLQLANIQYPSHLNKTEQQVYQCALFMLQQLSTAQLADGALIESKPKPHQALSYQDHFIFKPAVRAKAEASAEEQAPPTKKVSEPSNISAQAKQGLS